MEISASFLTVLHVFPVLQGEASVSYEKLAASMMNTYRRTMQMILENNKMKLEAGKEVRAGT